MQYLSLFFASIDLRRAALLIFAWLAAPLASRTRRRGTLAAAVREQLGEVRVFSFGSGRGALAACLRAAGVGAGDTVLLSSYTCLAVPAAVLAAGARPEYVDIDAGSLCTPAETLIAALHPRVRAVVVQHTLGRSAPLGALAAVTRERGITLIEDCALSLGSTHAGRPHGIAGDAAIFSMELSKTLSTGWGGVLAVSNPALADRAEEQYAQVPEPRAFTTARRVIQTAVCGVSFLRYLFPVGRYVVAAAFRVGIFRPSTPPGEIDGRPDARFVERLSGTQAVLGAAQWRRLPQVAAVCAAHAARLREALTRAGFQVLAAPAAGDTAVAPRVAFLVDDRAAAIRWFESHQVEMGRWFDGPLSPLPQAAVFNYDRARFPRAVSVAERVVNLPTNVRMRDADVARLVSLIGQYAVVEKE